MAARSEITQAGDLVQQKYSYKLPSWWFGSSKREGGSTTVAQDEDVGARLVVLQVCYAVSVNEVLPCTLRVDF
jgi:hypothetical protein